MTHQPLASASGILVHGCHLQAEAWMNIIWGAPPYQMGRLPHAVLIALEENAKIIIFGSGVKHDGVTLEGQYILNLLLTQFHTLNEFQAFQDIDLRAAATYIKSISIADSISQNTKEELRNAQRLVFVCVCVCCEKLLFSSLCLFFSLLSYIDQTVAQN